MNKSDFFLTTSALLNYISYYYKSLHWRYSRKIQHINFGHTKWWNADKLWKSLAISHFLELISHMQGYALQLPQAFFFLDKTWIIRESGFISTGESVLFSTCYFYAMSWRKSFDLYIVIMFATWKITYSLNVVFKIKFLTITRDVSNCTNNTQRLPATSYKIETKPHVHWKTSFMFTIGMPSHEYLSVFFYKCYLFHFNPPYSLITLYSTKYTAIHIMTANVTFFRKTTTTFYVTVAMPRSSDKR